MRTEVLAGVTTFLTMAYIIVVQPAVLSEKMFGTDTGLDFGAVTTATCVSGALATAIMALYARYPIAQAPGMGENFFFVFSALPIATAAGLRIYGSGILSSAGESMYCLGDSRPHRLGFDLRRVMRTRYRIDRFQQTYFVIDDFEQLFEATRPDFTPPW